MYDSISRETMTANYFGCKPEDMAPSVILSPVWRIEAFKQTGVKVINEFEGWYRGATLTYQGKPVTVISSGIGAPLSGDCALALQYTACENVFFSGSAGAVNPHYHIGDVMVAGEAVIGEGFSRYHRALPWQDCFGEVVEGSAEAVSKLMKAARAHQESLNFQLYQGRIFSIDSILGESRETFGFMQEKGCDAVEMEVSAVLTASRKASKKAAALILISDLPLRYRNLYEGIMEEEKQRYNTVKARLPFMLLEAAIA